MTMAGEQEYFSSLKDLLDYYHAKQMLGNIILPKQTSQVGQSTMTCVERVESDINPVFIEKFCEEIENARNMALEQDIADRLSLGQPFINYKCSFIGINSSRSHSKQP